MAMLTLRQYTAGFILVAFMLSSSLTFSSGVLNAYDTSFTGSNNETINELNKKVRGAQPNIAEGKNRTSTINIESDTFFLSSILNIISTVTSTLGSVPSILSVLVSGLGLPQEIVLLASIPVAAIIYEIVSLYRGLRT